MTRPERLAVFLVLAAVLWIVIAAAFAAGFVTGVAIAASRPAPIAAPSSGDGRTTERVSPLPSPDGSGQGEGPTGSPGPSAGSDVGRITPSVGSLPALDREVEPVTAFTPAAADVPTAAAGTISGVATWFDSPAGVSAAGPALRAAVGPGWRGQTVVVCAGERCIETVLGDWCACGPRPSGPTVIDLHLPVFAELAVPSRGVIRVEVTW